MLRLAVAILVGALIGLASAVARAPKPAAAPRAFDPNLNDGTGPASPPK